MKQYTITQAAALLGRAPRSVRQAVEKHTEIGQRVGAIWILDDDDLTKLAALRPGRPARTAPATPPDAMLREEQAERLRRALPEYDVKPTDLPVDWFTGACTCVPIVGEAVQSIWPGAVDDCPVHGVCLVGEL